MSSRAVRSANPLILDFADIGADALAVAGGKAANLGVLTRAGLPVPPGVCVTTEAYRQVTAPAGLEGVLDALAHTPAGDTARLAELAGEAREAIAPVRIQSGQKIAVDGTAGRITVA